MKLFRSILSLLLTVAVWPSALLLAVGGDLADGEREFVHELLDRSLFELAEQFCREQLKSASVASEKAEWELLLSECHQQHAWWMNDDSRNGMIGLAAQRITEFLRTQAPSAEKDILLRVRQIELLAAAGNMENVVRGDRSKLVNSATSVLGKRARAVSATTKFALEAINQGSELAEALLKQIDQIHRDVDSEVVRTARERIRLAVAQMMFVKSRFSADKDAVAERDRAGTLAEQLLKSTNDADLRFGVRMLLAEIQLDRGDFGAFDLRFASLLSVATSDANRASATALKIRALLRQAQPSAALQESVNYSKEGHPATAELLTLRLQALSALLELLYQLEEDSPQRDELSRKTADEFRTLKQTTLATTRGVWRDRCVHIAARFERVQQVGPEAASLLEEIGVLVDEGDLQAARAALHGLIQRLGTKDSRLSAIVLLQSGDLAVRLREWDLATVDLVTATKLFQESQDLSGAAGADLLRVYAIGQKWNAEPAADVAEKNYRTALNEHIATYAEQPTVVQAREWRARLMRASAPLDSAEELLEILKPVEAAKPGTTNASNRTKPATPSTGPDERLNRLSLAGDLLLEAMSREPVVTTSSNAADRLNAAVEIFVAESMSVQEQPSTEKLPQRIVLAAQQLGLSLRNPLAAATNWNELEADSRRLLKALSGESIGSSDSEGSTGLQIEPAQNTPAQNDSEQSPFGTNDAAIAERSTIICHAILVLSSVRQLSNSTDFESSRSALTKLTYEDRLRTVQQLMRQLSMTVQPVPGDPQLAHLLVSMITVRNAGSEEPGSIERQIGEFAILNRLCPVAGNQKPAEEHLNFLIAAPLTDSQIMQLAEIVAQSATSSGTGASPASARKFWQSVQKRTRPGQDAWFEASLQMASLSESGGDRKEASRILGVVSVLHPEWGNPLRKSRARELQTRLEASP